MGVDNPAAPGCNPLLDHIVAERGNPNQSFGFKTWLAHCRAKLTIVQNVVICQNRNAHHLENAVADPANAAYVIPAQVGIQPVDGRGPSLGVQWFRLRVV